MTFIGTHKKDILKTLKEPYTEFLNWLYLPHQGLLLSFEKQRCQSVTTLT